jgi:hypothetical protein
MTKRILSLALVLASFAAVAPAAVVYGRGYGDGARYYYGPRVYAAPVVPYVAPVYPAYGYGYRTYGYGYRGYAPRYYGGGYYRGGGYARGYRR